MNDKQDTKKFVVTPDTPISDIDLSQERFILEDGSRLTDRKAKRIASAALASKRQANLIPGRKSLSRDGAHSPVVQFRSPRRDEGQAVADELGITLSELARRAYDTYLDDLRGTQH